MRVKMTLNAVIVIVMSYYPTYSQQLREKIEIAIEEVIKKDPEIGISIGIIEEERVSYLNFGSTERGGKQKINNQTLFEIGSITKFLTAYLVAEQVVAKKIMIDASLGDCFKEHKLYNDYIRDVQISDLVSHQSGLIDFNFDSLITSNEQQPFSCINFDFINWLLQEQKSNREMGEYAYSNISYTLLGLLLELKTAKTYEALMEELIFKPLNMSRSTNYDRVDTNRAMGYSNKGLPQEMLKWNKYISPVGLTKSCSADLVKFLAYIVSKGDSEIVRLMTRTYFKNEHVEWGFGLRIMRENENVHYLKTGDTLGQSSALAFSLTAKWGIIVLTNTNGRHAFDIYKKLIQKL